MTKLWFKRVIFESTSCITVIRRSFLVQHIGLSRTINVSKNDMKCLLRSEVDQSIDLNAQDELSSSTIDQLKNITNESGIGPIKISCELYDTNHGSSPLDYLGFVGEHTVLLDANKSERYHGLLMIGEYRII